MKLNTRILDNGAYSSSEVEADCGTPTSDPWYNHHGGAYLGCETHETSLVYVWNLLETREVSKIPSLGQKLA